MTRADIAARQAFKPSIASRHPGGAASRRHERSLGLAPDWVTQVVGAIGNYGEVFDRHLGRGSPLGLARSVPGFCEAAMVFELTHSNATSGTRHIYQDVS